MQLEDLRNDFQADLSAVNQLIRSKLSSDVDLVETLGHHIIHGGGKRIRPLLVLMSARALNHDRSRAASLAAIVEFIHTATLLHDDVVDGAPERRGRPTANAVWSNAAAVLVGDFLYSRTFQMMTELESLAIMRRLADTTNTIAQGEVLQLSRVGDLSTDEATYYEIISRKTAQLFAAATELPAISAGAPARVCDALAEFGHAFGMTYQLVDDLIDYQGDPAETGKQLGQDLTEGKMTLPLIHSLAHASTADRTTLVAAIEAKETKQLAEVQSIIARTRSIEYTKQQISSQYERGLAALNRVNDVLDTSALATVSLLVTERSA